MPRRVAPEGDKNELSGPGQPELAPEQIQAKLDRDRQLWNSHVDQLRDEFIKVLAIVKARDTDKLFQAGSDIDRACEACHLETGTRATERRSCAIATAASTEFRAERNSADSRRHS